MCPLQLLSYGGFLSYSVVYDVPLDNEDRSLPAHFDIMIQVTKSENVGEFSIDV